MECRQRKKFESYFTSSFGYYRTPSEKKLSSLISHVYSVARIITSGRDVIRNVVDGETLRVFREADSEERQLLMQVRETHFEIDDLQAKLGE